MAERRVEILLDLARFEKVSREAARRGVSVAVVIREAIDQIPTDEQRRRAAIDAVLAAPAMPVPDDPRLLRRESDAARDRHAT